MEKLNEKLIEQMYSTRVKNSLDNIKSPIQDLTFKQLKIFYEERDKYIGKSFEDHLGLKMATGEYNYLAYLLSDNNKISVPFVVYKGVDTTVIEEKEELGYCSIVKALERVLEKFKTHNKTNVMLSDTQKVDKNIVSPIALREAVVNSFAHTRWQTEMSPKFEVFDDRIVISNFDGLGENITKEEFFQEFSAPVNISLMRILNDLGYVEQLGTGVMRIINLYGEDAFDIYPNFIRVSLYYDTPDNTTIYNFKDYEISDREKEVLRIILNKPEITQEEVATICGVSLRTTRRDFTSLQDKNIITRVGSNKKGVWQIK